MGHDLSDVVHSASLGYTPSIPYPRRRVNPHHGVAQGE